MMAEAHRAETNVALGWQRQSRSQFGVGQEQPLKKNLSTGKGKQERTINDWSSEENELIL